MFGCEQTTLFSAFDPRTFRYFNRIDLLDARREAPPLRFWFSRLDTLDSTLVSLFLEPGTRFKCILSDTVLARKLILLDASPEHPNGIGYRIGEWPILPVTELLGARDMRILWFSFFLGWLCNQLTIRYGGVVLFKRVRLLFVGLILGDFLMGGVFALLGLWTGQSYLVLPN